MHLLPAIHCEGLSGQKSLSDELILESGVYL